MNETFMIMRLNESGDWVKIDDTEDHKTEAEAYGELNDLDLTGSGYFASGPGNTVCTKIQRCYNKPL